MPKVGLSLAVAVLALIWQAYIPICSYAYKPGQFPGKGDYSSWNKAMAIHDAAVDVCIQGKSQQAIEMSRKALSYYPYEGAFWQNIGVAYQQLKQFAKAEAALRKSLELNPDDYRSWKDLANVLDDQNRLEEEKAAFYRALACRYPPPQSSRQEILEAIKSIDKDLTCQRK